LDDQRSVAELARWAISNVDQSSSDDFGRCVWSYDWLSVHATEGNPDRFLVSFADTAEFLIDLPTRSIHIFQSGPDQGVYHLLGDQVLPRILAHEGELVLHAAGVRNESGTLLFVGLSGSGKSTLAASLHGPAFRLVGDDAIVISEVGSTICGRAIYRSLRLLADSVKEVVRGVAKVTPVASYTAKQNVVFFDGDHLGGPLPIRAAFLLEPARGDAVIIEPITPSDACMAFVEHSFWMNPTDLTRTKARMTRASAMATRVPTFRLIYPREYSALPRVHNALAGLLS
jgi:hypothetical protein